MDLAAAGAPGRRTIRGSISFERLRAGARERVGVVLTVPRAVEIAERFSPATGPMDGGVNRDEIRERLRSGMTPDQISNTVSGTTRAQWLAAIEEEARLKGEFDAFPPSPESVVTLRDERRLRWERIAARIFGDAGRVADVRMLYDEASGPGAASRSYTGRGRRFPALRASKWVTG